MFVIVQVTVSSLPTAMPVMLLPLRVPLPSLQVTVSSVQPVGAVSASEWVTAAPFASWVATGMIALVPLPFDVNTAGGVAQPRCQPGPGLPAACSCR